MTCWRTFCTTVLIAALVACAAGSQLPTLEALEQLAKDYKGTIVTERERDPIDDNSASILSFEVDGLKQYALTITPAGPQPEQGWPVLIFNHGYVPVPADHGIRQSTGKRDRPGDYYRGIPEEFARNGFMVIAPDYRGHADSDGVEFTQASNPLAPLAWYSRDVVALMRSIESIERADTQNVFMLGHSMGGGITLNAVITLGKKIRAASLWSTSTTSYFPFYDKSPSQRIEAIATPLNIHHAVNDPVTPFANARKVSEVMSSDNPGRLYEYNSDQHLIDGSDRTTAFHRDLSFFRSRIKSPVD